MKELFEYIHENTWYKQALNTKTYYIFTCCKAAMDCIGAKTSFWTLTNMKYIEGIFVEKYFTDNARKYLEEQKKNPKFIDSALEKCNEKAERLNDFYARFLHKDLSQMSFGEIREALHELDKINYEFWVVGYICDVFDPSGDELLKEEIEKTGIKLNEKEHSVFLRTNWLNYAQQERFDLIKIAIESREQNYSPDETEGLLSEHAKKYFYVANTWESTTVMKTDDFMHALQELLAQDVYGQLADLTTDWEQEQKALQEKYNIPDSLVNVFYFFRQLFIWRDKRKKHTLLTNHLYDKFFQRIAEIFSVPFNDLRVILVREITGDLTRESLMNMIEKRRNLMIEVYSKGEQYILSGDGAEPLYSELHKPFLHQDEIIKGTGACVGRVKGIVRVVMGESHFGNFHEGEILVAPMTRPEYVPLMKKAAAIITDEGGITSHAAVVSREIDVPCIVGTQVATKVLRDGDLVELDAELGLVKILKKT